MSDIHVLAGRRWIAGLVATAVVLAGAAFLVWQHFYPAEAAAWRLLRFEPTTGAVSTLRAGLAEAEGVAICPDGGLFYSEKRRGWVRKYAEGGDDPIVAAALNQPSFLMCNAAGLWLTEDATHRARLLHIAPDGSIHTVLSGLRSGQTILETGPGSFLVAEQGRGRILELTRVQNAAQ